MIMANVTFAITISCVIIFTVIVISVLKTCIIGITVDVIIINCVAFIILLTAVVIVLVNQIQLVDTAILLDIQHLNTHPKARYTDWYSNHARVDTIIKACITILYMHRSIPLQSMTPAAFLIDDNIVVNRYGLYNLH